MFSLHNSQQFSCKADLTYARQDRATGEMSGKNRMGGV